MYKASPRLAVQKTKIFHFHKCISPLIAPEIPTGRNLPLSAQNFSPGNRASHSYCLACSYSFLVTFRCGFAAFFRPIFSVFRISAVTKNCRLFSFCCCFVLFCISVYHSGSLQVPRPLCLLPYNLTMIKTFQLRSCDARTQNFCISFSSRFPDSAKSRFALHGNPILTFS